MAAALSLMPPIRFARAVVLDTDGVITDSARRHAAAWKKACDAVLPGIGGQRPFDAVDDAPAGVEAGRRGGFGTVIGVDRTGGPDSAAALRRHGADLVVSDPGDLLATGAATVEATAGERDMAVGEAGAAAPGAGEDR
ncbi:hypothetical protein [Streptomyces sp. MMS24-I29]|uniref:hypothetical protein n=1 Tax=Streptomyces sp. MMS24-I29 TaxID=3351480 RepID=UPI003C7E6A2B